MLAAARMTLQRAGAASAVLRMRGRLRRHAGWRQLGLAASLLLALSLLAWGFLSERRQRQRLADELDHARRELASQPEAIFNLPIVWLRDGGLRGETTSFELPDDLAWLVVVLRLPDGEPEGGSYRLEVVSEATGETLWNGSGLREMAVSEISLALPGQALGPGEVRLLLYRSQRTGETLVETYALQLEE